MVLSEKYLTFTTLQANSADKKLIIFSYFSQKTGFDISCKLSEIAAYFLKKIRKKYFKMSSAEISIQHAKHKVVPHENGASMHMAAAKT